MTKSLVKVLAVVLVVALCALIISNSSLAVKMTEIDTNTLVNNAEDTTGTADTANRIVGSIMTVIQVVGMGIAVIMLIVLAIKYISAAPGDKADIKKHAVVYVVGAVVLFAAAGILQIVKNFASMVRPD